MDSPAHREVEDYLRTHTAQPADHQSTDRGDRRHSTNSQRLGQLVDLAYDRWIQLDRSGGQVRIPISQAPRWSIAWRHLLRGKVVTPVRPVIETGGGGLVVGFVVQYV